MFTKEELFAMNAAVNDKLYSNYIKIDKVNDLESNNVLEIYKKDLRLEQENLKSALRKIKREIFS